MMLMFSRGRIGFRCPRVALVWYPRRGSLEAWLGRFGALRYRRRWVFTRTGQLILSGGTK